MTDDVLYVCLPVCGIAAGLLNFYILLSVLTVGERDPNAAVPEQTSFTWPTVNLLDAQSLK